MKFNYQENSLKSGIYKIINTHTNRVYIGQAKEFKERWKGHASSLRRGKCMNRFLLNDFNKCQLALGHDDFLEFHILELMENSTKEERNIREEKAILAFFDGQDKCYNLKTKVSSNERACWSSTPAETSARLSKSLKGRKTWNKGLKLSDEYREKLSIAHRGKTISPETRLKMSEAHKGTKASWFGKKLSEEHCRKLSESHQGQVSANKKEFRLIGPDGIEYHNKGITGFCIAHKLNRNRICLVISGKRADYKGWHLP